MSDLAVGSRPSSIPMESKPSGKALIALLLVLAVGIGYAVRGLVADISAASGPPLAIGAFVLLGLALLIALGFEFVNGFHDTANAVATVIYTRSLAPTAAVILSGTLNLLGVLWSSGTVAFGIIALLPVELILNVGSSAGYAMIFSLLIAAIVWNLGTWWRGLPASSSHTMVGSIIGVGVANQLLAAKGTGTSGVDWSQAEKVFAALIFSPLVGFFLSAGLLLLLKFLIRIPALYKAPEGKSTPPWWVRGLLILTCSSVSFAHGSNDGQKGMGLIMLILIGAMPTAFALNHAMTARQTPAFIQATTQAEAVFTSHAAGVAIPDADGARAALQVAVEKRALQGPGSWAALDAIAIDIANQVQASGSIGAIPAAAVHNVRNDMYLTAQTVKLANSKLDGADKAKIGAYAKALTGSTQFIPPWVKVAVAIALGLGTMVGWKRIVVTVGEKIGKTHLTYGQGAAAEIVAAITIMGADRFGLPVSTTHILSSGIAGTMAANGSGLQWDTVRDIALAWVLTLPCAMLLSGILFAILRAVF